MTHDVLVNLHCHSQFSDGELTPEALAKVLAKNGVRYASLTDHDTLEGQHRFQIALAKTSVVYIPGVEITTFFEGREIHLLGYGFNVKNAELNRTLISMRQTKTLENVSIAGSIRKSGTNHHPHQSDEYKNFAPSGVLSTRDGIQLIHHAGGIVFLAHPLTVENDPQSLSVLIKDIKKLGLDGIEAIYSKYSGAEQEMLVAAARESDLLLCAGTDFHYLTDQPAINFYYTDWKKFKELIIKQGFLGITNGLQLEEAVDRFATDGNSEKHHHFKKRAYTLRIFLPTIIAISIFMAAIWIFVLPSFESTLLDRKREMIRELTNSAISILTSYYQDEQAGIYDRNEAQALAIDRIQSLRYGEDSKDYFWIQDTYPTMIMHPYLPELNGENLLEYKDPRGVRIFVEFANLVQQRGEGYIEYVWQWNDDPERLEPKESFVKLFSPWGWIIGTGIYIDDVNAEIDRIEKDISNVAIIVSIVLILLLSFVLHQSLQIEKGRQEVLDDLKDSTERYHAVIETMTEGTLLVIGNGCQYANATFLKIVGYAENQLPFLDLADILPRCVENQAIWDQIDKMGENATGLGSTVDGFLQRIDQRLINCLLILNPIRYSNQSGFILLARTISRNAGLKENEDFIKTISNLDVGIFKAKPTHRCVFLEINQSGDDLLPYSFRDKGEQPNLADLFESSYEFDHFLEKLHNDKKVKDCLLHIHTDKFESRIISLSAKLEMDKEGNPLFISGTLRDVSHEKRLMAENEELINKLQSSLLFFHEPLSKIEKSMLTCNMNTSILQVSKSLTNQKKTAALITSDKGDVIGIVTDHDLRARVIASEIGFQEPIYSIMTSPVVKCASGTMIFEAMILMEENGVRHLAVEGEDGQIENLVDIKMLVQYPRYGAYILERENEQANSIEQLQQIQTRKPKIVKAMLESSRNVNYVTKTLSSIHDSSVERIMHFAYEEIGPPPSPFVFVVMGSQGRQEPTLLADQDNGIIFESNDQDTEKVQQYFLDLGSRVTEGLYKLGNNYCAGNVMASNPFWCKSLEKWKIDFNKWVISPEPENLLDLSIFFDLRAVVGETRLVQDLRKHVFLSLQDRNDFFYLYAKETHNLSPQVKGLGGIFMGLTSLDAGDRVLNLKDLLMPITGFARLYALSNFLPTTHTLERVNILAEKGVIPNETSEELVSAYEFLMQLRLKNQVMQTNEDETPDNTIRTGNLSDLQKNRIREVLSQISALQKRIAFDFLSGYPT